jgi:uncharacterized membrane protein YfcA
VYNRAGARTFPGWRKALTEVSATLFILAALFFLVAAAYSSVGLGGGSSYVALLSIFGFGTAVIPLVSLALNLLVTSVASYNFIRQRHALPRLIVLGLGSEKQAAACGAIFVWLTSLAGLIARLQYHAVDWVDYAPLYVAVILGAALGSFMGSSRLSAGAMEKVLGAIVIVAIGFLGAKILSL